MIVLDTSVVIAHLRGDAGATELLETHAVADELILPALAYWELLRGAAPPFERAKVDALVEGMTIDALAPAMARLAADLYLDLRRAGREPPAYDLLIASHALFHNAPLATLDRDYGAVPGVRVVRPSRRRRKQ